MIYGFENIMFWSSFYWSMFSPAINLLVAIGFNTLVVREVYNMIKDKYNSMIEIEVTGN